MTVQPFTINIPQAQLDDLRERLTRTRWTDEPDGAGWMYGSNLAYLKELTDYWQNTFDWRAQEAKLNQFAHFRADIDGVGIHFIHEKGKGPNPTPIILTHGWPDSFYRFHKIIPMLTDPARFGGDPNQSFDVIVPSIPGFGFSDRKAMASSAVADLWVKLMGELGYERFAAAGGDVGSGVTIALAQRHPEVVTAVHLTDVGYPTGQEDPATMSEAEQQFAGFIQGWWFQEGAYAMLHMSKPQSLAVGLNDSPAGWAAWAVSFINTGADDHQIDKAFGGRDELLTNLTIYWVTQTIGSAARSYMEEVMAAYSGEPAGQRSSVSAGIALFPREAQFPREWAERSVNVQHLEKMPRGGHFAPLEEPELFVADLRAFFKDLL
jgi:pimeloyl-ACP methyl ester carboxylesterase